MRQVREIPTELYLLDLMDATETDTDTCSACGETFEIYEHNPHTLCVECVDTLQADADLRYDFFQKRDGLTPQEKAQQVQDLRDRVRYLSLPTPLESHVTAVPRKLRGSLTRRDPHGYRPARSC